MPTESYGNFGLANWPPLRAAACRQTQLSSRKCREIPEAGEQVGTVPWKKAIAVRWSPGRAELAGLML
jgi:hypothetical protein